MRDIRQPRCRWEHDWGVTGQSIIMAIKYFKDYIKVGTYALHNLCPHFLTCKLNWLRASG